MEQQSFLPRELMLLIFEKAVETAECEEHLPCFELLSKEFSKHKGLFRKILLKRFLESTRALPEPLKVSGFKTFTRSGEAVYKYTRFTVAVDTKTTSALLEQKKWVFLNWSTPACHVEGHEGSQFYVKHF